MRIERVKNLSPLNRFLYWIKERHDIYLRRLEGRPKPWTDDEILQRFFFTNPYRENDKVTAWFRETIREPLRDRPSVLFATVAFRWFNLPETGKILWDLGLLTEWDTKRVLDVLRPIRDRGGKIFTGAFMINSPGGEPKLEAICRRIENVYKEEAELIRIFNEHEPSPTMEEAHKVLTQFDGLGGFMAYEIVCDLRYTYLLENAPDKMTWCNPGPGAIRGLYRIAGEEIKNKSNSTSPPLPKDWNERMARLLEVTQRRLSDMHPFEMREIEHSLCEYDKYSRALSGDGRMKRTYRGA